MPVALGVRVHLLFLQGGENALGDGVVLAIAPAADAALDAVGGEQREVLGGRERSAAIGMHQQRVKRLSPPQSHLHGANDKPSGSKPRRPLVAINHSTRLRPAQIPFARSPA